VWWLFREPPDTPDGNAGSEARHNEGEEERIIGIVGVHEIQGAKVEGVVAGDRGKIRVQKVVSFS